MNPDVTVLLPVYNGALFIKESVQSILAQTYTNFELLIIDDGSEDSSGAIVQQLAQSDSRIRLVQRENRGLISTLNEGLRLAKGRYIARMDADDVALPERLGKQVETLEQNPNLLALGTDFRYMDAKGRLGRVGVHPQGEEVLEHLYWGTALPHPTVMYRKDAVLSVGGYRPQFIQAEDYDLWLRLIRKGELNNLGEPLLYYRLHGANSVITQAQKGRQSMLMAQALWILQGRGVEITLGPDDPLPAFDALPLEPDERSALLGRALAYAAHFLGGVEQDEEGRKWLMEIHQRSLTSPVRYSLAVYYLRCARFYFYHNKHKVLENFHKSLCLQPMAFLHQLQRITRQLCKTIMK